MLWCISLCRCLSSYGFTCDNVSLSSLLWEYMYVCQRYMLWNYVTYSWTGSTLNYGISAKRLSKHTRKEIIHCSKFFQVFLVLVEISVRRNIGLTKCGSVEISVRRNIGLTKCPSVEVVIGRSVGLFKDETLVHRNIGLPKCESVEISVHWNIGLQNIGLSK